jgi:DNA-binding response OmpR family regulator
MMEAFYIMAERMHHYLHEPAQDSSQRIGLKTEPPNAAERVERYGKGSYILIVDIGRHEVTYQGVQVTLPPMAFRLLSLLAEKPDRIVSKEELYGRLWGKAGADNGPYEHQLADHKRKILAQIGKAFEAKHGKKPEADQIRNLITAKSRVGYRLNLPASAVRLVR